MLLHKGYGQSALDQLRDTLKKQIEAIVQLVHFPVLTQRSSKTGYNYKLHGVNVIAKGTQNS